MLTLSLTGNQIICQFIQNGCQKVISGAILFSFTSSLFHEVKYGNGNFRYDKICQNFLENWACRFCMGEGYNTNGSVLSSGIIQIVSDL